MNPTSLPVTFPGLASSRNHEKVLENMKHGVHTKRKGSFHGDSFSNLSRNLSLLGIGMKASLSFADL
jgi:hypothetical protein